MIEELKNLPDISFIENMDVENVQTFLISEFESKYAELAGLDSYSLPKASIYRIILNANAALIYQALQYIDRAGKSNMLKDTYGEYLDNLATLKGVTRNPAQPATVTVRFNLESARGSATAIPSGTRVSSGGDVLFATSEYTEIPPGEIFKDVKAKCLTNGITGNDFAIGEINVLVDPVLYINSVINITKPEGGADTENDDSLKKRVFYAPSAYSSAGSLASYLYWVQSYSNNIIDVNISTEEESATVDIRVLLENGKLPDRNFLNNLLEYISTDDKKPLTDLIRVSAPSPVEYGIDFTYYINQSDRQQALMIQNAVTQAVEKYKKWQNEKIGRDVNPDKLREFVMSAGAKRVEIAKPLYCVLSNNQVASLYDGSTQRTIELNYQIGGIDHTSGSYTETAETTHIKTPVSNVIKLNQFTSITITVETTLIEKYGVKIWMCDETGSHAVDNAYSSHNLTLSKDFTNASYDKDFFGDFVRIEIFLRTGTDFDEDEAKTVVQSIIGEGMINVRYGGLESD